MSLRYASTSIEPEMFYSVNKIRYCHVVLRQVNPAHIYTAISPKSVLVLSYNPYIGSHWISFFQDFRPKCPSISRLATRPLHFNLYGNNVV
jgi:hypothetical protein